MTDKKTLDYLFSIPPVSEEKSYCQPRKLLMDFAIESMSNDGIVMEFGVAGGESARHIISRLPGTTKVFLFDSFQGLPEDWVGIRKKGRYAVATIPRFDEPNVKVIAGLFNETLPGFVIEDNISLIHMDADLYSSTKTVLDAIGSHIKPGTLILFDEYFNYPEFYQHEYKAFHEWVDENNRNFEYIGRTMNGQALIRITG